MFFQNNDKICYRILQNLSHQELKNLIAKDEYFSAIFYSFYRCRELQKFGTQSPSPPLDISAMVVYLLRTAMQTWFFDNINNFHEK